MANPVDGMTTAPITSGFYNYPPQTQLPQSVTVTVNQAPQMAPLDSFAYPTAYRPSTDQHIGDNLHPTLENVQYASPVNRSRYSPTIVYPSGVPHYQRGTNGVASDMQNPEMPVDPTQDGSR